MDACVGVCNGRGYNGRSWMYPHSWVQGLEAPLPTCVCLYAVGNLEAVVVQGRLGSMAYHSGARASAPAPQKDRDEQSR
jgi:hypothetical protein